MRAPLVCLPSPPCPPSPVPYSSPQEAFLRNPLPVNPISEALELLTDIVFLLKQHLNENLAKLTAKFEKATADKLKCQQEAEATAGTISLANRLVSVNLFGRL